VRSDRWSSLASGSLRATCGWSSLASGSLRATCSVLALCVLALAACNRKIEPFDPNEKPREPDLSKIFPEGADSAEPVQPGLPPPPGEQRGTGPEPSEVAAESSDAPVTGTVELAPEFEGKTASGAVLFIIARRGGGPPLAVKRVAEPHFPHEFSIGPEDRMIKAMPFAGPIELSARIDRDGNAMTRSPGDVTGTARGGPVQPGATGVVIVLDTPL
jgi:cytochrome c-type biogenesis protein CcmH